MVTCGDGKVSDEPNVSPRYFFSGAHSYYSNAQSHDVAIDRKHLSLFILIGCLYYLVKTIVFQKRIDGIRHEFLKNMIYELKQPKEDDKGEESAVFIGSITFYYAQNELLCGNSRVVITSRQAEILKLLAENQNQLVERDFILNEVWGDDSYSNSLALNVQITYLRRALNLDEKVSIEAVIKKGYILRTC